MNRVRVWLRVLAALASALSCGAAVAATPPSWPEPRYKIADDALATARFELGRQLFYDPVLSRDDSTSCASCHQQAAAFAHPGHRLSHGIGGQLGTRNAPGLFNLAWDTSFMWDGSIEHLELQPLAPIANAVEMGESPAALAPKLLAVPGYAARFTQAFGSPGIDTPRILKALAQFTGALTACDARYDRVLAGRASFTPQESHGLDVFRAHCAACHAEPLFTDSSFRSNGLDAESADAGRAKATAVAADRGRFRVPSLRNVAVTAPYTHDGRLPTLDAVLDHYDHGIVPSTALDPLLTGGIPLAPEDRAALLAFLDTLTDQTLLTDARFSDPAQLPAKGRRLGAGRDERLADGHPGSGSHAAAELWDRFFGFSAHASTPDTNIGASRIALADERVELVIERAGDLLRVYADDFATNAPLDGVVVTITSGTLSLHADGGHGTYTAPADRLDPTHAHPLRIALRGNGWHHEIAGELPAGTAATSSSARRPWGAAATFLFLAFALLAVLVAIRRAHQSG